MSKPSVLAIACRLAPSIKSAMRFDLDDIDVDQRIICKQRRSAFSPQALVGLNWTIKLRLWRHSTSKLYPITLRFKLFFRKVRFAEQGTHMSPSPASRKFCLNG
jgi:hypothetical protein